MKKQFEQFRPKEFSGIGDQHLYPIIGELIKLISRLERQYYFETLKLDKNQKYIMCNLLVELAEDLHNDIGLWKSIEQYNKTIFNTPLPLFIEEGGEITECFDKNRIKFFVYNIFIEFDPDVIFSPQHKDLETLANGVTQFFNNKFKLVPKDSGVKLFLHQKDKFGWDFKRKLVWLGLNSYLFRYSCFSYAAENNKGKTDIGTIDDFICQENTIWSGLGVIDIIAEAIELSEKTKLDVKSWYERLVSFYKVISIKSDTLEVENIINNQKYSIQEDGDNKIFKKDEIVFGGLVPYNGFFYWSGVQHKMGKISDLILKKIKTDFVLKSSRIVYRYDKALLEKAQESVKDHYEDFKNYFKNDLVVFKDGITMADGLQKMNKQKYVALTKEDLSDFMSRNNLKNPFPNMNISDNLLNSENGIGVFFNPNEGIEIMLGFEDLISGFKKNGSKLSEDEMTTIQEFIFSKAISPAFVQRLITDYGEKSIASAFLIHPNVNCTAFLLHKYKGHFYRNRYPEISFKIN